MNVIDAGHIRSLAFSYLSKSPTNIYVDALQYFVPICGRFLCAKSKIHNKGKLVCRATTDNLAMRACINDMSLHC